MNSTLDLQERLDVKRLSWSERNLPQIFGGASPEQKEVYRTWENEVYLANYWLNRALSYAKDGDIDTAQTFFNTAMSHVEKSGIDVSEKIKEFKSYNASKPAQTSSS
jgi:hypothetical protein